MTRDNKKTLIFAVTLSAIGIALAICLTYLLARDTGEVLEPHRSTAPQSRAEKAELATVPDAAGSSEARRNPEADASDESPPAQDLSSANDQIPWQTMKQIVCAHNSFSEHDVAMLRFRYLGWPVGNKTQLEFPFGAYTKGKHTIETNSSEIESIIAHHNALLNDALSVASEFMEESFADYYGNEKFAYAAESGRDRPERRPTNGSTFWRDGYVETGGWSCQLEFRSADYPAFEGALQELVRLSSERQAAVELYVASLPGDE